MPSVVEVKAQKDFWDRLCKTRPIRALSELVWNSFDADSRKVSICIDKNPIDGIDRIRISDNGTGIALNPEKHLFSSLGGSWKNQTHRTLKEKRILHGRTGQGRFRAFALGDRVTWSTRCEDSSKRIAYDISGSLNRTGFTGGPNS
jgi:HSP90 family molecular chaperone